MKSKSRFLTFLFILLFPLLSQAQWDTSGSNTQSTSDRIFLNDGNLSYPSQRMGIVTTTDRIGLYVENRSTVGVPPLDPTGLCLPEGTDWEGLYFGIYVARPANSGPGGYAGYFDGRVGVCGGLMMTNQEYNKTWAIEEPYGNGLSFIGLGSDAELKLMRNPSVQNAYANIILEDATYKAIEVIEVIEGSTLSEGEGPDIGTSNFFVQGNGLIDTKYGLTIHNGQATHPIRMISVVSGDDRFKVKNDGHITTLGGLRITATTSASGDLLI